MADRVDTIAIVSAMSAELKPVLRALGLAGLNSGGAGISCGTYRGAKIVTAVTTMGLVAAQRVTEELFARFGAEIDHLFVVGIAGANDPQLHIGDVLVPTFVVDARDGVQRYPVNLSDRDACGIIYSTDQLGYSKEYVALLREKNVSLVDMESGAIAAVCERNNCPFTIVRAVSDRVDAHAQNYDVFGLAHADGSPNYPAAIRYLLKKPWKVPYLVAMALGASKAIGSASTALVKAVDLFLEQNAGKGQSESA